ncbi:hypothetical protein MKZ38_000945 [Zalerion maritima]|uniref:cysteine--tRNA ligase n=1 Tax=Zalerion maritima TaxID=339359 RepID=A0AAD5RS30_9PEZI|nr:hypothetical protein MKZ38_000945 [Zalerion maritima]
MDTIKVHNSLRPGGPMPFKPIEEGKVKWYACGPTVYDQSHLGHARNYVSTDIIRRIMKHYFGFDVNFVMNFTDVDDKIILRARRLRLLDLEKKKLYSGEELHNLGIAAFQAYATSSLPLLVADDGKLDESNYAARRDAAYGKVLAGGTLSGEGKPGDDEAKIRMHVGNMDSAARAIQEKKLFGGADDVLQPYLDFLYKETIDTSDQTIFTDLTRHMEGEFTDDMDALNVLRPDVVTRVTDYVPQIAKFVEKIVEKGFAYEAEGSVYFDIAAFEKAGNTYARLRPESRNDKKLLEDGEGSLGKKLGGKKGPGDFALWKKSKAGEPYWPSKWGDGRPGWHIECSVMASDVLGEVMDIHSGGIDLAFPHHDNELAQSEAFFCRHEKGEHTWVNYFMHMGHLSISGSKMSKSLKNFQTIKDALKESTARSIRIIFLMGRWNDGVEISPDMRLQAEGWEFTVNNFFTNIKSLLAEVSARGLKNPSMKDKPSSGLMEGLEQAKKDLHAALVNSFDTPRTMSVVLGLIKDTNIHIREHKSDADFGSIETIARWITKIVGILGLDGNAKPPYEGLGWAASLGEIVDPNDAVKPYEDVLENVKKDVLKLNIESNEVKSLLLLSPDQEFRQLVDAGTKDVEQLALPHVRAVSRLRDEMRRIAPTTAAETKKSILSLSDRIRDYDLTNLGVYLDDRTDGQPSLVKFVPAVDLIAAREEKAAKDAERARAKEAAKRKQAAEEAARWEKAKLSPTDMFKADDRFSAWDGEGMPTKMKDGSDMPKSQMKKLKKEWDRQKKLHDEYNGKFGGAGAS